MKSPGVRALVRLAIEEDLSGGDITSELLIDSSLKGEGRLLAKEPMIFCSAGILPLIFEEYGGNFSLQKILKDGAAVKRGDTLGVISGTVKDLLAIERTVLNFLQRLSGVSTHVSRIVKKARRITVLDTRKTLPGYRTLDKYAVTVGGGKNHRRSLSDMILIKNNHIDALKGGVKEALKRVSDRKPPATPVEIEVRDLTELEDALLFQPDWIMLDNMKGQEIARAVKRIQALNPKIKVEVSGGVAAEKFASLQKAGVAFVSMGTLTTKATNVDISMGIKRLK